MAALARAWWEIGSEARREAPPALADRAVDEWITAVDFASWLVEDDRLVDARIWARALGQDPRAADDPEAQLLLADLASSPEGCAASASRAVALRDDPDTVLRASEAVERGVSADAARALVGDGLGRHPGVRALQERWAALGGGLERLQDLDPGDWLVRLVGGSDFDGLLRSLDRVRTDPWHVARVAGRYSEAQVRQLVERGLRVAHAEIEFVPASREAWERAMAFYGLVGRPDQQLAHARHAVHHAPNARWAWKMWVQAARSAAIGPDALVEVAGPALDVCGRDPTVLAALEPLPLDRRCLELVVSVKAAWERFAMPDAVEIAEEARRVALLASPALTMPYFAYTRTMGQCGFTSRIASFLERMGPAVAGDRDWTLVVRLGLLTVRPGSSAEAFLALVREFDPPAGEARVRCLTEAAIRSSEPGPLLDQAEEAAGDRPDHRAMVALARASCGQDVEAGERRQVPDFVAARHHQL
ncbi:MAG: hypothetical protein ABMB14_24095, partial [Myxococcota bacterium]